MGRNIDRASQKCIRIRKHPQGAIELLEEQRPAGDPTVLLKLANFYIRSGRLSEAETLVKPLHESGHPEAICYLAMVRGRQGNTP